MLALAREQLRPEQGDGDGIAASGVLLGFVHRQGRLAVRLEEVGVFVERSVVHVPAAEETSPDGDRFGDLAELGEKGSLGSAHRRGTVRSLDRADQPFQRGLLLSLAGERLDDVRDVGGVGRHQRMRLLERGAR